MMTEHVLVDDFGRRTKFVGEKLVEETTDSSTAENVKIEELRLMLSAATNPALVLREVGLKPQWLEVEVWRTQAGSFVVQRTTSYRIRHLNKNCTRAEGYDLEPAGEEDTYPCPTCNKSGVLEGGWAQCSRVSIDVYQTPQDLILGFQNEGRFNNLARTILADISEQDPRVDAAWNTVVVP